MITNLIVKSHDSLKSTHVRASMVHRLFIILLFLQLLTCTVMAQSDIPSNKKSSEIVQRVSIVLQNELDKKGLKLGSDVYIRIFKVSKELELWVKDGTGYRLFKTYSVCTYGRGTLGPKLSKGDGQAPEGFYVVGHSALNPSSKYHLSIGVGYPNEYDRKLGSTGSGIMIHAYCASIGCFAMTDRRIEEIYTIVDAAFRNGQTRLHIDIFPFRMIEPNLKDYNDSKWSDYWRNLQEGYDSFEKNNIPPVTKVKDHRYIFN